MIIHVQVFFVNVYFHVSWVYTYVGVALLGHVVILYLTFGGTAKLFPQRLHHFIPQCVRIPIFPYCCQHLLFSIKKKYRTWMDLEIVVLSEGSQAEKDKYMISLICGI